MAFCALKWTIFELLLLLLIGDAFAKPKKKTQGLENFEKWQKFVAPNGQIFYGHIWAGNSINSHPCNIESEPQQVVKIDDILKFYGQNGTNLPNPSAFNQNKPSYPSGMQSSTSNCVPNSQTTKLPSVPNLPNNPYIFNISPGGHVNAGRRSQGRNDTVQMTKVKKLLLDLTGAKNITVQIGEVGRLGMKDSKKKRQNFKRRLKTYGALRDFDDVKGSSGSKRRMSSGKKLMSTTETSQKSSSGKRKSSSRNKEFGEYFNLGYQIGLASSFALPKNLVHRRSGTTKTNSSGGIEDDNNKPFIRTPHTFGRFVNSKLKNLFRKIPKDIRQKAESLITEGGDGKKARRSSMGAVEKVEHGRNRNEAEDTPGENKSVERQHRGKGRRQKKSEKGEKRTKEIGKIREPPALINYLTGEVSREAPRAAQKPKSKDPAKKQLKIKLHNPKKSHGNSHKKNVNHIKVKIKGKKNRKGVKRRAKKKGPVKVHFKNIKPKSSRHKRSILDRKEKLRKEITKKSSLKRIQKLLKEDPKREKIHVTVTVCVVTGKRKCEEHAVPQNTTLCTVGPSHPSTTGAVKPGTSFTRGPTITTERSGTGAEGFEVVGGIAEDQDFKISKKPRVKRIRRSVKNKNKVKKQTEDISIFPKAGNFSINFCIGTSCPAGGGGKKPSGGGGGGGGGGGTTEAPSFRSDDFTDLFLPSRREKVIYGIVKEIEGSDIFSSGRSAKTARNGSFNINFCLGSGCGGGGGGGKKPDSGGGGGNKGGGGEGGGEGGRVKNRPKKKNRRLSQKSKNKGDPEEAQETKRKKKSRKHRP